MAVQVARGGENIEGQLSIGGVGLAGAVRLAVAAKIDGEDLKAGADERGNLGRPALLGETAAVNEENGAICVAIQISGHEAAVFSWKGNRLLRVGYGGQQEGRQDGYEYAHPANVLRLSVWL